MCLSVLVCLLIFFFNLMMDDAEISELKPRTPRPPAREGLSPWEGGFAPPRPGDTRGSGATHAAALGVVSPPSSIFSAAPRVSAPGPESLIVIIN